MQETMRRAARRIARRKWTVAEKRQTNGPVCMYVRLGILCRYVRILSVCPQRKHPLVCSLGTAWRSQNSRVLARHAECKYYCVLPPDTWQRLRSSSAAPSACGSPSVKRRRPALQFSSASSVAAVGTSYARVSSTRRKSVHVSGCLSFSSSPVLYETTPPTGQINQNRSTPPFDRRLRAVDPSQSITLAMRQACPTQTVLRT